MAPPHPGSQEDGHVGPADEQHGLQDLGGEGVHPGETGEPRPLRPRLTANSLLSEGLRGASERE